MKKIITFATPTVVIDQEVLKLFTMFRETKESRFITMLGEFKDEHGLTLNLSKLVVPRQCCTETVSEISGQDLITLIDMQCNVTATWAGSMAPFISAATKAMIDDSRKDRKVDWYIHLSVSTQGGFAWVYMGETAYCSPFDPFVENLDPAEIQLISDRVSGNILSYRERFGKVFKP